MFLGSLIALASLLLTPSSVYAAPVASSDATESVSRNFNIRTLVTKGSKDFGGLFLVSFHTGAGENAVVATTDRSELSPFTINNTYITQLGGEPPYPYTFGLTDDQPYNSTAPSDDLYVSNNVGKYTRGFEISGARNIITYTGKLPFETFVLCKVAGVSPYYSVGPEIQLLWRKKGDQASYTQCADVNLQARFVN